jgi:hypothetical protein
MLRCASCLRGVGDGSRIEDDTIWRHRGRKHVQNISSIRRAVQGWLLKRRGTRVPKASALGKCYPRFHLSRTSSKVPILSA